MTPVIDLKNVTKKYKLYKNQKERFLDLILPLEYGEDFHALKDVDFQAEKGDTIGFVGINGSGKSTLLNIIAGVIPETAGEVSITGNISLISVSSGLKDALTGRENIELKCLMLGFSKKEIKEMEEGIIEFSDLGKFIDQPVKSYSSGMKSRLGFSISVSVNPDILIIDEALSVGDKTFAQKCLDKINEFKKQGKTILFVSHSNHQIKQFCDKVFWLEYGKVKAFGPVAEVMKSYEEFIAYYNKLSNADKKKYQETHKFG
ncbi:teichoic acid export protein ATP-binding subunit [Priestia megaterium]|nr:teichoic acid export protein ATP-binding subunit [Priestia megaterium]